MPSRTYALSAKSVSMSRALRQTRTLMWIVAGPNGTRQDRRNDRRTSRASTYQSEQGSLTRSLIDQDALNYVWKSGQFGDVNAY